MRAVGYSRSSSFTLGVLFTGLLLLSVYFINYFMTISRDQTLIKESVAAIDADIRMFTEAEHFGGMESVDRILNHRLQESNNGFFYALRDNRENWVMGNLPAWPSTPVEPVIAGVIKFDVKHTDMDLGDKDPYMLSDHFDIMAKIHTFNSGHQLIVGRDIDDLEVAQWLGQTFGWMMIAIMLIISGTSIWVGFYVVSRINRIADTADNIIETGNLKARIPVDSNWDDLSKLSVVLNRMLAELEDMVEGVKSVSDNIAHDLRTPLARLRGDLERIEDREIKGELLAEADNILSIFNGLLRIADIETEKQKRAFKTLDLAPLVKDVVELYRPLAEDKSIEVGLTYESFKVYGDRDLLFQAFANIIDNAIKFTPEKGCIGVTLGRQPGEKKVTFAVCDSGIGISEEHREQVTRRFFRVEKSRHQPGNGLGLALVAAVIQLHKGELSMTNAVDNPEYPGLCCTLTFPVL